MAFEPTEALITALAILGVLLALTVQRCGRVYRVVVGTIAVATTLVATLAYIHPGSTRPSQVRVARAEPTLEPGPTPQSVCVRRGIVPACNCVRQR
jgi:hypothetical protein